MSLALLICSTLLQYLAAGLAARLVLITRHRTAWLAIALALLLMGVRRSITLWRITSNQEAHMPDVMAEGVALAISILMVVGVASIGPLFRAAKKATEELQRGRRRLQGILDHTPAAIFVKDPKGRYAVVNREAARILGLPAEQITGKFDSEFLPRELAEQLQRHDELVREKGEPLELDETLTDSEGRARHYLTIKFPLAEGDGPGISVGGVATDITERVHAEERRRELDARLQHTQKLESLGVLAGGIAHDFNNLLATIMGGIDLAQADPQMPSEATESLDLAMSATETAASLCRQLLAYSGGAQLAMAPVEVSSLVADISQLVGVSLSKKASFTSSLATDLPRIKGDSAQLQQVVMNLITNASDALGTGTGTVSLETRLVEVNDDNAVIQQGGAPLPPGAYVCIEVSDSGEGMTEDTKRRLFEPFFSTKVHGRGLGLAAVMGIVRGHGGGITVESAPLEGSSFRVYLPVPPDTPLPPPKGDPTPQGALLKNAHVLVVDDEPTVLKITEQLLETFGFTVRTADNGRTAVEEIRSTHQGIDLIVLDMTMPELDGKETYRELRKHRPDVPVLFMSGYDATSSDAAELLANDAHAGFIQKPFTRATLEDALTRLMPASTHLTR